MSDERFAPDLDAWEPWSLEEVTRRLAGFNVPWCVAGGWALDLFLGRITREHEDLEIAVPAARALEIVPAFPECEFFAVGSRLAWPWRPEITDESHQTWLRERATGKWRLDIFREPHDGDTWICRRNPDFRRPYAELIHRSADGIPYAAPEVILFFKAKAARPKDEADFERVSPAFSAEQREWLLTALQAAHPDHPWITHLTKTTQCL